MQRSLFQFWLLCVVLVFLAACAVAPPVAPSAATGAEQSPAQANTVTAIKVDSVSLDAEADFWAGAPILTVPTVGQSEDEPDGPEITIQAVYDDQHIAMRFEWADEEASLLKNAWTWDGEKFTKSGDEDRVQLLWPIDNMPEFASKGCAAACHNLDPDQEKWWMGTDTPDLRYDLWHWKSTRTHLVGQSDDQWVSDLANPDDVESPRRGDAKESGGYKDNINEAGDGPAFMHPSDPDALFIPTGEEAPLDTSALEPGTVIPGFLLAPAVGSRGDLAANGVWADGKWVVVIMRPLDTGHDDDVIFTPPKVYPFGLSVTNNGGGLDHTNAPDVLTLVWE
ncbi:MAG: hypothetical protein DCC55_16395 [Chloroflexi bacterium]|nr:MAG: hypothetical protein DCC55_16395 [Chloroflexota bacterium]